MNQYLSSGLPISEGHLHRLANQFPPSLTKHNVQPENPFLLGGMPVIQFTRTGGFDRIPHARRSRTWRASGASASDRLSGLLPPRHLSQQGDVDRRPQTLAVVHSPVFGHLLDAVGVQRLSKNSSLIFVKNFLWSSLCSAGSTQKPAGSDIYIYINQ
jgi:hypothetical protein